MKGSLRYRHLSVTILSLLVLLLGAVLAGPAVAQSNLQDSDCVKCHEQQPADIAAAGESHKDVSCQECHEGHRPSSPDNIPECSNCHEGESHFELANCLGCHRNPHTPLKITLEGDITDPCLTCHTEQNEKLQANQSAHTDQYCSNCHDVHGKIPECLQCHEPHSATMVQADCGKCHEAHQPLDVKYEETVENSACGSCHAKPLEQLSASTTKHQTKACAFCHKARHKAPAVCTECHDIPHPQGILNKFPNCGDCHKTAHDLNNWPAQAAQ